jgi:hypothetical protein
LPGEVESKRLHNFTSGDKPKGSIRYTEHVSQEVSDQDKYATKGSNVDLHPSEEELMAKTDRPDEKIERIIKSRERKET